MSDEIDPINQKVAELLSYGVPEEDIVNHLSNSQDQANKFWVQKWKALQTSKRAEERTGASDQSNLTDEQSMLSKAQKWASENPITAAGIATGTSGLAVATGYAVKERIKTNAEIRKAKELAKIVTPSVKQQNDQLILSNKKHDLAVKEFEAKQNNLIKSETDNAIQTTKTNQLAKSFEKEFGMPLAQAEQMTGGKITNPMDAKIIGNALTKGQGVSVNPMPGTVSNQPAGIPSAVNPMTAFGNTAPVTPSVETTVAAGGNVGQAVKEVVAKELDQTNRTPSGMRENYKISKAEPIGPGAFNHLANNVGIEKAAEIWKDVYGEKNVPYKEYMQKYSQEAGKNMYGPVKPLPEGAKPGGSLGTPKYIPEYIKGGASIGGMVGAAAIPALAAAGYHAYKGNKEAVNTELKDAWNSMKSVVTMPVDVAKAAGKGDFGPFKDMLMSMNPGTLLMNEANKRDEAAIQRMIQAEKVGAGRGIAPPSAYQR